MTPLGSKAILTETGIEFREPISYEEWCDLGRRLCLVGRSVGFMLGDWINYGAGQKDWGDKYTEALQATGLDPQTLRVYSMVARRVPLLMRINKLSFEHHRKISSLPGDSEKQKWLGVAANAVESGTPLTTRRLAKSILLGRVATDKDMQIDPADKAIDNPNKHINRLVAWWCKMKKTHWLSRVDEEKRQALKRDLQPIVDIYNELQS